MAVSHEKIVDLVGTIDGVNKDFTTPSPFIAGTIKVKVNGVTYAASDDYFGFTEVGNQQINMVTAPKSWYTMQAFYSEAEMQGSPFHPTEL